MGKERAKPQACVNINTKSATTLAVSALRPCGGKGFEKLYRPV